MEGAVERVRPKMMTVIAIMAGLLPILWSHGTGSEVMQRIAVPMIGGMVSSTVLTLVVIPAIYALVKGIGLSPAGTTAPAGGTKIGGDTRGASDMMNDGWMWGMGLGHIVIVVLVALVIAALVKYVFFR